MWRYLLMLNWFHLCGGVIFTALSGTLLDRSFPDDVLKFAVDSCDVLPVEEIFSKIAEEPKQVYIFLFTPSSTKVYKIQHVRKLLTENPKINSFRSTTIYIHGWHNHPYDESSQTIVNALLTQDTNVLLFDASKYMNKLYLTASSHVFRLGQTLNKFLIKLSEKVPVKKINLIGFSLGAHVAGVAGKLFRQQTGKSLNRITALDPARPCFERLDDQRLNRSDAKFVDVIHTNPGTLGLREALGHVDFYVNGISGNQPECRKMLIKLECDHAQSWRMFAASVERGDILAKRCSDWLELNEGKCSGESVVFGYGTPTDARGLYYVNTRKMRGPKRTRRSKRNNGFVNIWSMLGTP